MLADGMPVRWKDLSQSEMEGPRMFPSMYANPGQRVQVATWRQLEQTGRSFARMERTSASCGELRQISMNFCRRTFPLGNGNWTQGYTSPLGAMQPSVRPALQE